MKKQYIYIFLIAIAIGSGIYQYSQFFQSELAEAYQMTKPTNGHSWGEMQCTSDLCVDTVNHRVGIGTDSPRESLDVAGRIQADDVCVGSGATLKCLSQLSLNYSINGIVFNQDVVGDYIINKYLLEDGEDTGSTNWNVPTGVTEVDVLVVAGGGSGAYGIYGPGGGGAGGVVYQSGRTVYENTTVAITVGKGGTAVTSAGTGQSGSNSRFGNIVALGGGAGEYQGITNASGGSGGGAGLHSSATGPVGGSATQTDSDGGTGYGNAGGGAYITGSYPSVSAKGGAGGGAGSVGDSASSGACANGGAGLAFSITGSSVYYAGGGGGGGNACVSTQGGIGGGGGKGVSGENGLGAGGGGQGGAGGSGVVIVKYLRP